LREVGFDAVELLVEFGWGICPKVVVVSRVVVGFALGRWGICPKVATDGAMLDAEDVRDFAMTAAKPN
jgi:hypothetical protein